MGWSCYVTLCRNLAETSTLCVHRLFGKCTRTAVTHNNISCTSMKYPQLIFNDPRVTTCTRIPLPKSIRLVQQLWPAQNLILLCELPCTTVFVRDNCEYSALTDDDDRDGPEYLSNTGTSFAECAAVGYKPGCSVLAESKWNRIMCSTGNSSSHTITIHKHCRRNNIFYVSFFFFFIEKPYGDLVLLFYRLMYRSGTNNSISIP